MFMRSVFIIALMILSAVVEANTLRLPSFEYMQNRLGEHANDMNNPHSVNKEQLGLNNVQNVDQTDANNLTSGTVPFDRLPVGTSRDTVAAGDDVRFDTIATGRPSGTPPAGSVFVWVE